jgi:hypothetical protein
MPTALPTIEPSALVKAPMWLLLSIASTLPTSSPSILRTSPSRLTSPTSLSDILTTAAILVTSLDKGTPTAKSHDALARQFIPYTEKMAIRYVCQDLKKRLNQLIEQGAENSGARSFEPQTSCMPISACGEIVESHLRTREGQPASLTVSLRATAGDDARTPPSEQGGFDDHLVGARGRSRSPGLGSLRWRGCW